MNWVLVEKWCATCRQRTQWTVAIFWGFKRLKCSGCKAVETQQWGPAACRRDS